MVHFIVEGILIVIGVILLIKYISVLKKKPYPIVGILRIDTTNEEKDVYTLEVGYIPLSELANYKEVAFKIETGESHK